MPEYIDCHAHINFPDYDSDRSEVIERTLSQNTWMVNVGTSNKTSKEVVDLANKYSNGVYAIVGSHPTEEGFNKSEIMELAKDPKVVAIGETGLDYFRDGSLEAQRDIFESQIEIANEIGKPLMLHIRGSSGSMDAYEDTICILKEKAKVSGNAHFFAGTVDVAKKFLEIGFSISFTGVITFTKDYDEVIKYVPVESILSETDCPFVAPNPFRGKRNEPLYVKEVVSRLAEIKGLELEEVQTILVENALRLFSIDK
ncbi:MAG: TatD family hydrolase [Candidatus Pacebacteria bacterium]|nr:TatD family hydrolase [Candidatus Paceibacterota bacterium]